MIDDEEEYKLSHLDQFKNLLFQTYHRSGTEYYNRTNYIWDSHIVVWLNDDLWYMIITKKEKFNGSNMSDLIISYDEIMNFLQEHGINHHNIDDLTEEILILFKIRYIL